MSVREVKWPTGAYAREPRVTTVDDAFRGEASIECWLGTPDELLAVMSVAECLGHGSNRGDLLAAVTWLDGTRSRLRGLIDVRQTLMQEEVVKAQLIELRKTGGDIELTLRACRGSIPGLSLEVVGVDQRAVGDACASAYRRMMIGYVDRLGGWRSVAFMLLTVGPIAVLGQLRTTSSWLSIAALALGASWAVTSFLLIAPKILTARPFTLVAEIDRTAALRQALGSARSARADVRTWLVGTIAGIVTLSVLANLLTDAVKRIFQSLF